MLIGRRCAATGREAAASSSPEKAQPAKIRAQDKEHSFPSCRTSQYPPPTKRIPDVSNVQEYQGGWREARRRVAGLERPPPWDERQSRASLPTAGEKVSGGDDGSYDGTAGERGRRGSPMRGVWGGRLRGDEVGGGQGGRLRGDEVGGGQGGRLRGDEVGGGRVRVTAWSRPEAKAEPRRTKACSQQEKQLRRTEAYFLPQVEPEPEVIPPRPRVEG
ncbi:uncharacterized protein LOC129185664 [Dunckerocampus dactyliophorus]|uniref:uncharacterized protein LOC129185664 n=1 Tax=Dunckerocampus dactyliophorus TaxID=161453 RepID=UPI002404F57C|nr:uncharacterized protein LOC129185664 [Dunckerocampus dactyliophorus]